MAKGLKIENDAGQLLVIDDGNIVPWFQGKATHSSTSVVFANGGDYDWKQVDYTLPGTGRRLIACTLPTNAADVWYRLGSISGTGSTKTMMVFFPAGTEPSFALPEMYCFAIEAAPPASTGKGMRMRNDAGGITFDSGSLPLVIRQLLSHTIPTSSQSHSGTLSKPALICPAYAEMELAATGPTTSDLDSYAGAFQRVSSTAIKSAIIHYEHEGVDAGTTETFLYGLSNSQALPLIDGAMYD